MGSLSHAEVAKDVSENFLGVNFATCDFCKEHSDDKDFHPFMRGTQKQIIAQLEAENATLKAQVASLQREVDALRKMVKLERPGCPD